MPEPLSPHRHAPPPLLPCIGRLWKTPLNEDKLRLTVFYYAEKAYDTRFLLFVDDKFEDIGTAVVAGSVEFHVAQGDLIHVEVGIDEGFLVPNGLGEIMTTGIDDAAAPRQVASFSLSTAPFSTRSEGYMSLVKY